MTKHLYKFPLDITTFNQLRSSGYIYVDKTRYAFDLITKGRRYFLARPRRFGKSLFVSTLAEILKGNKELFNDLEIGGMEYSWHEHAVIALDLSVLGIDSVDIFKKTICRALIRIAKKYKLDITLDEEVPELALVDLVGALYEQYGRVAVLIDEYDQPLLQVLQDIERAKEIRDALRRFFAAIKGLDAEIDFVFITGVSSFAKAGLFSGMNNLRVISLNDSYAAICGYTDGEISNYFGSYIAQWAQKKNISYDALLAQIKQWYNGYCFAKNGLKVYNPFSVMNALELREFKNYWFQSGTPSFLIEILKQQYESFDPDKLEITENALGVLDIGSISLLGLMFQAGYLTIGKYDQERDLFILDWPNLEVERSFGKYLIAVYTHVDAHTAERVAIQFRTALNNTDIPEAIQLLDLLFSKIPYPLHIKEEKYYHSLLIIICVTAGIQVLAEHMTSDGRIDLVIDLPKTMYILEIKFNQTPDVAIDQIKSKGYVKPFLGRGKQLILLGVSFNRSPQKFEIKYHSELLDQ